jgi:hypothetical protein
LGLGDRGEAPGARDARGKLRVRGRRRPAGWVGVLLPVGRRPRERRTSAGTPRSIRGASGRCARLRAGPRSPFAGRVARWRPASWPRGLEGPRARGRTPRRVPRGVDTGIARSRRATRHTERRCPRCTPRAVPPAR